MSGLGALRLRSGEAIGGDCNCYDAIATTRKWGVWNDGDDEKK